MKNNIGIKVNRYDCNFDFVKIQFTYGLGTMERKK